MITIHQVKNEPLPSTFPVEHKGKYRPKLNSVIEVLDPTGNRIGMVKVVSKPKYENYYLVKRVQ